MFKMMRQLETRPITHSQLLSEIKSIYAALLLVETKCQEVDQKQTEQALARVTEKQKSPGLCNEQWQALIALHGTLLHEHYNFFLASQHPSSTPSLRKLAEKYAMPTRMWQHGIHNFLELLRSRLPESLEHMRTFTHLAYSNMALLYETIPAFEETWIECLGDLSKCRMAIEDDDIQDREVWANVAKSWYLKGVDRRPSVGRLYHHLAIIARPNLLDQLFYYCKSLTVLNPFPHTRKSVLSLFGGGHTDTPTGPLLDVALVKLHQICFTRINFESLDECLDKYLHLLEHHLCKPDEDWTAQGALVAICNIAAIFEYNGNHSKLRKLWREHYIGNVDEISSSVALVVCSNDTEPRQSMPKPTTDFDGVLPPFTPQKSTAHTASPALQGADLNAGIQQNFVSDNEYDGPWRHVQAVAKMGFNILDLALKRTGDDQVLPHVHTWLVFLHHLRYAPVTLQRLEADIPWQNLVIFLNSLLHYVSVNSVEEATEYDFEGAEFSRRFQRPLSEDWMHRGLEWSRNYFPGDWMEKSNVALEERLIEKPSMITIRKNRILWLGHKLDDWITFDPSIRLFAVGASLAQRIEEARIRATRP